MSGTHARTHSCLLAPSGVYGPSHPSAHAFRPPPHTHTYTQNRSWSAWASSCPSPTAPSASCGRSRAARRSSSSSPRSAPRCRRGSWTCRSLGCAQRRGPGGGVMTVLGGAGGDWMRVGRWWHLLLCATGVGQQTLACDASAPCLLPWCRPSLALAPGAGLQRHRLPERPGGAGAARAAAAAVAAGRVELGCRARLRRRGLRRGMHGVWIG